MTNLQSVIEIRLPGRSQQDIRLSPASTSGWLCRISDMLSTSTHELKSLTIDALQGDIFMLPLPCQMIFLALPRKFHFCLSHYLGVLRKTTEEFWREGGVVMGRRVSHYLLVFLATPGCLLSFSFSKLYPITRVSILP